MTGYGRAEVVHAGRKFSVELNSVNRKQSDIVINLPRDLGELEPRIRQTINENISRGRTNAMIVLHSGPNGTRTLALDTELADLARRFDRGGDDAAVTDWEYLLLTAHKR